MAKLVVLLVAALCAVASAGHYGYAAGPYGHGYSHYGPSYGHGYQTPYYYNAVADVDVHQTPYSYQYSVNEHGPYHSKYIKQSADYRYGYPASYGHGYY